MPHRLDPAVVTSLSEQAAQVADGQYAGTAGSADLSDEPMLPVPAGMPYGTYELMVPWKR
ncbi:hypothetical protein [Streptomyces sp. NPDC020917]|uniref:hypothetical protein n=1 Tax=Streptomyces sp. NPDC020917 TaxID=3365102 RepID=UPI0037983336